MDDPAGADAPVLEHPVVIVGMMAAGKTTLGRALAEVLGVAYLDSDRTIEDVHGRRGRELAASRGVEFLHALEADILLAQLDRDPPGVISAAASVVDSEACRAALRAGATVCWLDVALDVLVQRLGRDDHRRRIDPSELRRSYDARTRRFSEIADIRLDGSTPRPDQLATIVAHLSAIR